MLMVVFGTLDAMVSELKQRGVKDVRVAALHGRRTSEVGKDRLRVDLMTCYVNVDGLLPDGIVARYKKVVFDGIAPIGNAERHKEIGRDLEAARDGITTGLQDVHNMGVRAGHYEDL